MSADSPATPGDPAAGPATPGRLRVETIVSVPFEENTYVLWLDGRDDCVVVDPGLQPGAVLDAVQRHGLAVAAVLNTHGHSDHIAGNEAVKQRFPDAPLVIGAGDADKLGDPEGNLSAMFGFRVLSPPADRTVLGGDAVDAAGMAWRVLETPGHSGGHVTFVLRDEATTHAVSGDVLFRGGVGRTDFPDGDFETLRRSIHDELFALPDDAIVYPGHGGTTTVGEEKRTNPYVGVPAGYAV